LPLDEKVYAIEFAEIAIWALKQIAAAIASNELGKILGNTKNEWEQHIGDQLNKIEAGIDEIISRLQAIGVKLDHLYDDGVKKEINLDLYGYKHSFQSVLARIEDLDKISDADIIILGEMAREIERLGFKSLGYGQHCYSIAIYSFGLLASIYQTMAATDKRYINSLSSAALRFLPEFQAMINPSIEKSIKNTLDITNNKVNDLAHRVLNIYPQYKRFALAFHHIRGNDDYGSLDYYKLIPGIFELNPEGFVTSSDWQGNSSPYRFKETRDHEGLPAFPGFPAQDVYNDQDSHGLLGRVVNILNLDASTLSQEKKALEILKSDVTTVENFIKALEVWRKP
jgi:hypothetical protein